MKKSTSVLAVFMAFTPCLTWAMNASDKYVSLEKLHQRYVDARFNTVNFPELNEKILVSGTALKISASFSGKSVLYAGGDAGEDDVLARLNAENSQEDEKLKALKPGASFKAACYLGMTMGSDWMALQDCTFGESK